MADEHQRSRRAVLGAGVGALIGGVAAMLGRPLPVAATQKTMSTGVDNAADAETRLYRTNDGVVFSAFSPTMPGFQTNTEVVAIGTNAVGGAGINSLASGQLGYGVVGRATGDTGTGVQGVGSHTGVYGEAPTYGVQGVGLGLGAVGVLGLVGAPNSIGVHGVSEDGTAVLGEAGLSGNGGQFSSVAGNALAVYGRLFFSRAGRAIVAANKAFVDVSPAGGIGPNAFVLATIQGNHPDVSVASVRLNYPATGKARIYLTKVASTTGSTPIGWIAIG
ncbi:MAG TPA: hypothetical protein VGI98_06725 [Candidatus Limnocylindrales bacterium]